MKIYTRELWPGHRITIFKVKRWFGIYRIFNLLFARTCTKREFAILDEGVMTLLKIE